MGIIANTIAAWRWLPVIIRAPIVAFLVLSVGSTVGILPIIGNTKFLSSIPWSLPVTAPVMGIYWLYFTGHGYPAGTKPVRQDVTRLKSLPWTIWRAAVLPMVFSLVAVITFRLMLPSILPVAAPKIPFDLSKFHLATTIGLLLSVALTAGIAEEVALRGYLQKPLEDSYGIVPAVTLTGIAFWLVHADKVSLSHLPFHLLASILLGLLVYFTKSLLPAIICHTLGDALLLPAYALHKPRFVWSYLTTVPVWTGSATTPPTQAFAMIALVFFFTAAATVFVFIRLARIVRR